MEENIIKRFLQGQWKGPSRRSWRCPDETRLAAYADRELTGDLKESLERHLAGCDSCLAQVSFLTKSAEWTDHEVVPAHLLARARELVSHQSPLNVWGWRLKVATAGLACLVLAIALGIVLQSRRSNQSSNESLIAKNEPTQPAITFPAQPATVETPTRVDSLRPEVGESPRRIQSPGPGVRHMPEPGALAPTVLFPTERATVTSAGLVFRWTAINDAESYEISLMTDAGDVVFTDRSTQTELKLPAHVRLTMGGKYFVRVTANMPQGITIKSSVVGFRVSQ
ncbi:MAG: zf-HC2 domain-containing protein [Pyrinomonadaceae bacterium]